MNTRFMLVRHATCAQTDNILFGRLVDAPLDARGERQASALAARIARERPMTVLTSPRRRARHTARPIAAQCGCPIETVGALDEIDFGTWSGLTFAQLEADPAWQRWNSHRSACRTPAGDHIAAVQLRIATLLHELAAAFPGRTLVLVTHAEIIRSALLHFLRMPVDDYLCIDIQPASLTRLSLTASGMRCEAINEQAGVAERIAA